MTEVNVSIIIPTYNVAPYIRKCLESVAAQTYTGSMECFIVDDCGQDNSIQIAEEFIKEYNGPIDFRIIHREKNDGLSAARNSGIREAKGEYLYFLDSDDYITYDCIQSMWQMVERFPGVECVFAGANVEGSDCFTFMDYTKKQLPDYSNDRDWLQESMLKRSELSMTAWNRLISAEFIRQHNLYFEEGFIHEDEIWNLLISQVITKAAFIKVNTYNYIIRGNSIMNEDSQNMKKTKDRHFRLYNILMKKVNPARNVDMQIRCIINQLSEDVHKYTGIQDFLRMNGLLVSALHKSTWNYKLQILKFIIAWNMILCKRVDSKS